MSLTGRALGMTTIAVLFGVGMTGGAFAQTIGQASSSDMPWWRVVSALVLCLALAVGAAFVLKARLRGGPLFATSLFVKGDRRLEAVETLRLGQQLDVHLFRHDGKEVLIASTPNTVVVLSEGKAAAPRAKKA